MATDYTRAVLRSRDGSAPLTSRKRLTAALQEAALARLIGAGERRRVRHRGAVRAADAPEQIGADRVKQVPCRLEFAVFAQR